MIPKMILLCNFIGKEAECEMINGEIIKGKLCAFFKESESYTAIETDTEVLFLRNHEIRLTRCKK